MYLTIETYISDYNNQSRADNGGEKGCGDNDIRYRKASPENEGRRESEEGDKRD